MKYGYARVSSSGQNLTIQVEALTNAGCETIRQEKVSGTSVQGRDELNTLLEFLRDGDELVVTRVDMLGVFGEFETNLRKERQMEGISKAKKRGVYKGRKPSVDVERVKELRDSGMGASAIAKEMGIGRASVYRALG